MVLVGYEIRVSSVSNSLFAELSRKVSSPLMLFIIRGSRLFSVIGESSNVKRFLGNLMSCYGSRNVSLKRLQASEAIYRHVKTIARCFA